MGAVFEESYRVNSRDVDRFNQCRPSAVLGYLQEAATGAAKEGGFTRERLLDRYNLFWMLARVWYRLDKPIFWDQELTVCTWHRGNQGMMMYRDYDMYVGDERIGEGVSVWVLADRDTKRLSRMSNITELQGTDGGPRCKDKLLHKLHVPDGLPLVENRLIHYSDTDVNGHVNNSRYADFACDAASLEQNGRGRFVSSIQLGYLAECRAGEMLGIHAGEADGAWLVRGRDKNGAPRFDAEISLSPLDKG